MAAKMVAFFIAENQQIYLFDKFVKKSNGGLNGSPKGRRVPLRAVRPILFSSPPMIGLCGGEYYNLSQRTIKMTNSNLIPVFNGLIANQPVQLCNARELHAFVESKREYATWIKDRISDYGFVQNEDYIIVTERTLGRPRKEYHITLDMGKELAMVERNEKGRMVRKYFIECERKALQKTQQNLPLAEAEADEEAIRIIANLYHSLNGAYEMGEKLRNSYPHLAKDIDKVIGGHYLYNLNMPTENALEKARKYVHAKSERIMFIKGMLSLLEQPQSKRLVNF